MTSDLIHAYFSAFNLQDLEGQLAVLSPDIQHDINEGRTETGIEAFRAFKAHMDACYKEQIEELVIFENGDRGAAEFMVRGEYIATDPGLPEATGQKYMIRAAIFVEVAENKITRMTSYYNLQGWRDAIAALA